MKISADINKKAWSIRKSAAARQNCKVSEISWAACLRMAKEQDIATLDYICKRYTGFDTFEELIRSNDNYNPTMADTVFPAMKILANAFDDTMRFYGKNRRANRYSCGFPSDYQF